MRISQWFVLVLLGALGSQQAARAQVLVGHVTAQGTGQPLGGVYVTVDGRGVASDSTGAYRLRGLRPGPCVVRYTHISRIPVERHVDVRAGRNRMDVEMALTVLMRRAVTVSATRAVERETPVAFSNVDRAHIEQTLTTADVPTMLNELPGVHTWSTAGNGVGYTYLSIRGFPQERIAVTVNGIPLNDPESHMVYWINMPDLMESVEDIQVQRGVGTSPYGAAAIGGSVNLVTGTFAQHQGMTLTGVLGSYGTTKFSAEINSGLVHQRDQLYARFSRVRSDGYRDQSWSDLWSYYVGAVRQGPHSSLRLNFFGGTEQTHFSFFGATREQLRANRRANPYSSYAGATDNFTQPHYQLIHEWTPAAGWLIANSLYLIQGDGYFKDQHFDASFTPVADIRRDVLDMTQVGWIPRVEWRHHRGTLTVGGEIRNNDNHHWGEVMGLGMEAGALPGAVRSTRLYDYDARKTTLGAYVHERCRVVPALHVEAHLSAIAHVFDLGDDRVLDSEHIDDFTYVFVMPRFGATWTAGPAFSVFANYSVGRREPALTDLFDPAAFFGDADRRQAFTEYDAATGTLRNPRLDAERLRDYEVGAAYAQPRLLLKANLYYMDFSDEIVATGQVLGTGGFAQRNAAASVHKGLELSVNARPGGGWETAANLTLSSNRLDEFAGAGEDDAPALDGRRLPGFPERLANARMAYQHGGVRASLRLRYVGGYYFDLANSADCRVEAYTLATLRLSYDRKGPEEAWHVRPSLEIDNLFDTRYETWGGLFYGTPTWIPGAERSITLMLRMTL